MTLGRFLGPLVGNCLRGPSESLVAGPCMWLHVVDPALARTAMSIGRNLHLVGRACHCIVFASGVDFGVGVVAHMDLVVAGSACGTSVARGSPATDAAATPLLCSASSAMAVGARPSTSAPPQAAACLSTTSAARGRRGLGS